MSSAAINDVTRGLQVLLLSQLQQVSATAQISLLPPGDGLPTGLGVNLYLYRITESQFTKNQSWPGDRTTPSSRKPALGLELFYLLTPFAPPVDPSTASGDDAHTMLGAAMLVFHENPILTQTHIKGFDADAVLTPALLNSFEDIKIRLTATGLEELSKIWATINQPYRLSVAYEVSLVELTPTTPPMIDGAVVLSTKLDVVNWAPPVLNTISPATGSLAHVDASGNLVGNLLTITGSGFLFSGQVAGVSVGGTAVPVSSAPSPTNNSLAVTLSTVLDAGPENDVRISLSGKTSAPMTFVASPWLAGIHPIRTALEASSALLLEGKGFTATPQGVRFEGIAGTRTVTTFAALPSDARLSVAIPGDLSNGLYDVRVVLAPPANSASNSRQLQVIPSIALPVGLALVTLAGNQVHQITLNGARLGGADLRVVIDGNVYFAGANANPAQVLFTVARRLTSGPHTIALAVDGILSHTVPLVVS